MWRSALQHLYSWKNRQPRRPILVEGARAVGKTELVRRFARDRFQHLVELDFEAQPELAELFRSGSPVQILPLLEMRERAAIIPGECLLFLDEIQAAPQVLACLRRFQEQMPALHVILASSLWGFLLERRDVFAPVGKLEFLHLGPLQFEEFLRAAGEEDLLRMLQGFSVRRELSLADHGRLMGLLGRFVATGGMPAVVAAHLESGGFLASEDALADVQAQLERDFTRYGRHAIPERLARVHRRLPLQVGRRFKYVDLQRGVRPRELAATMDRLCRARLWQRVPHSGCDDASLPVLVGERRFKMLCLDVGLMTRGCGLGPLELAAAPELLALGQGAVCRQLVGQHLLHSRAWGVQPRLRFWVREKSGSNAQADFVITVGQQALPVMVKAGKPGWLKALQLFVLEKGAPLAVRLDERPPSLAQLRSSLPGHSGRSYWLLSLPLYLVGQLRRLCGEVLRGMPSEAD